MRMNDVNQQSAVGGSVVDQDLDTVLAQHAVDYIKTFQSEYEKITVDVCITCIKRWF